MRIFGILMACATLIGAQEEAVDGEEVEKVPKRSVRLLAVGNAPPYRQEVRDGIRYELPPPPGSVPPRELTLVRQNEEEVQELGEFRVQLGRISGALEIREGAGTLQLRGEGGVPWASVSCPESGDFMVLLWRDPAVGSWSKPLMKIVEDPREAGTVRFLNVSRQAVALVVDGRRRALRPLQGWVTELGAGKPVSFQLGLVGADGGLEREMSVALEQSADESTLVIISDADGQRNRRPLKITRLRERVRE